MHTEFSALHPLLLPYSSVHFAAGCVYQFEQEGENGFQRCIYFNRLYVWLVSTP